MPVFQKEYCSEDIYPLVKHSLGWKKIAFDVYCEIYFPGNNTSVSSDGTHRNGDLPIK